jgi:putative tricarboxylic transport membrane protein
MSATFRTSNILIRIATTLLAIVPILSAPLAQSATPEWRPDKVVELIVGTAGGGSQDQTMRTVQKILQGQGRQNLTISIVNKPGGGGAVAVSYLTQHPGNAHYLYMSSPTMLTNQIIGTSKIGYTNMTPISHLLSEYIGFTVRADSPITNGAQFIERLKRDPASMSIAIGTAIGNGNHIALAQVLRAAGMPSADLKRLKVLAFKAGVEGMTALLGGHIDALVLTPSVVVPHLGAGGRLRMIAIAAPSRQTGALASVPTWREQGINSVNDSWKVILGPEGMTPAQISYWENAFSSVASTAEWKTELEENQWVNNFKRSPATIKFLADEQAELREALSDLGLIR